MTSQIYKVGQLEIVRVVELEFPLGPAILPVGRDPEWTGLDQHPDESPAIRRALLQECAARNALMIGVHFGSPGAGRVRPIGDAWRLEAS